MPASPMLTTAHPATYHSTTASAMSSADPTASTSTATTAPYSFSTVPKKPGAYSVSTESQGQPVFYKVAIPPNTEPGTTFTFSTTGHTIRRGLTARCPPECMPGEVLQVAVLPEPETQHVPLKMALLTAPSSQEQESGGRKPMSAHVQQVNQDVLQLMQQQEEQQEEKVSADLDSDTRTNDPQVHSQQDPSPPSTQQFVVTVPASVPPFGANVDRRFIAHTPHGDRFLVTCPDHAKAHDQILLQVPNTGISPSASAEEKKEQSDRSIKQRKSHHDETKLASGEDEDDTKLFQITAPDGVRPNQILPVLVCGKRIPITLPPNVVPGQTLTLKLPMQTVVNSIELSYDHEKEDAGFFGSENDQTNKGWCRTIRMSDKQFQWVNSNDDDTNDDQINEHVLLWKTTAFVRKLVFLEGNDPRMRTGTVSLIPARNALAASELKHPSHHRTLVSYATVAHIQTRSLEEKTAWFQKDVCANLMSPWDAGRIKLLIRRDHLVADSVRSIMALSRADLRKRWRLEFLGEPAIDSGGVMREWFQLVTEQMFNPDLGLWLSSVHNQICMRINPASDISCPDDHLIYFRFLGRVMGRALFDQQLVSGHMVRHIYKHMLGWPITFEDLKIQDEEYYNSLKKFTTIEDVSILCLDFTVAEETLGLKRNVDLIPNGSQLEVTSDTLPQYLEAILKYRMMGRTKPQMTELLLGFFDVIPEPALTVFDPNELELLMCGLPIIDMDDWVANTNYTGTYLAEENGGGGIDPKTDDAIKWFWEVVRDDFDQEMKARLLQFVTGTSGVPSRGFSVLQGNDGNIKKFSIHGVSRAVYVYPRAHTCFNRIDLPKYATKEELHEKLKAAITLSAVGFDIE